MTGAGVAFGAVVNDTSIFSTSCLQRLQLVDISLLLFSVFAVSFASWDKIEEMLNGRSDGKPGYSAVCVFVVGQRNEVLRLAPENAGLALRSTAFWRWSVCTQIALRSIVAVWAQAQSMAWITQRRVEGVDSCCFALCLGGI
jgi:hypothetical protein